MNAFRTICAAVALAMSVAQGAYAIGAIAVDAVDGIEPSDIGYGVATGYSSRPDAENAARRECAKAGNRNCRVAVWFETCGAYAASRHAHAIGWGNNMNYAKNRALSECGPGCRIVAAVCE